MNESIEHRQEIKHFESDQKRFLYIKGLINEAIDQASEKANEKLSAMMKEKYMSLGDKELRELEKDHERQADQAIAESLSNLGKELNKDSRLKDHLPEVSSFIEAVRIMFLQKGIEKYKEYALMKNAPRLSEEAAKEQDRLREDLTEGRALLQWHILQNEKNPEYLQDFSTALDGLWEENGFGDKKESFLRGLTQELGVYRLLKKYFPKVTPATPKEDAHFAIDFWVETKKGKTILLQTKSSGMFGGGGVFNEDDIKKLAEEKEHKPEESVEYYADWGGEQYIPPAIRAKKLALDADNAKKYAGEKGIKDAEYFLIISNSENFEYPLGKAKPGYRIEKLGEQLEKLAVA